MSLESKPPEPKGEPMKLTLISLPWSAMNRPSAALGALAAYVRQHEPRVDVEVRYEYAHVGTTLGARLYGELANLAYEAGELLYMPLLYPEKRDEVLVYAARELAARNPEPGELWPGASSWEEVARSTLDVIERHLEALAREVAGDADVVGLTTCFGQLFANVALAQRIKALAPDTKILLGGSTISGRVGPSVMREYPYLDFITQGEGELPLVGLLRALLADRAAMPTVPGLLTRANMALHPGGIAPAEVPDMDALPVPQYDEYADFAERTGISWLVPIEGSRGCWWDRVHRANNPKSTCYFCNLNVQWRGYRQKTEARVVSELAELSERYSNGSFFFLDNILRFKGVETLARSLAELGKDLSFFYEMRAHVRPWEILVLWEAGLTASQFGIEALSTSMLKRVGKGTTCIQNLEVMKTCFELGIHNQANLILDFPTSTQLEVEETCRMIERVAVAYQPLEITRFHLGQGSTAEVLQREFGIVNVRNRDSYRAGLPEDVWRRLSLLDLSFDLEGPLADWTPVERAVERWRARVAAQARHPERGVLTYQDGGSFLRIQDRRGPNFDVVLKGATRELYLYCCEIRSLEHVLARFGAGSEAARRSIEGVLTQLTSHQLMFREGDRILSLAAAQSPRAAARRIQMLHDEAELEAQEQAAREPAA
ncbi:RiPP maturation radical SAM C-methyltransferase [Cystobacter fuscus]|uniref:RiPP maturation radical SAM C-methyltransferase n=1 Tax=Cystobacter fuscus TaxID=43 RepID=UPI002B2B3F1B|nr:RiPP maturation radical SAM protein 1 [Cystobacter fuscus]